MKVPFMNKLKYLLFGLLLTGSLFIVSLPAYATTAKETVCEGVGSTQAGIDCAAPADGPSVDSLIATVIKLLSLTLGVVAVVMFIVGALKYMTSGGDANAVASAKKTILYALVGLVLTVLSQVIIRYVLYKTTH